MTPPESPSPAPGPILDVRARWRAGQIALAFACLLLPASAWLRPLRPGAAPGLRLTALVVLALGLLVSAFLASLRNRGRAESLAFYAFLLLGLDGLGQWLSAWGLPDWPLLALLVGALAVAEALPTSLGFAGATGLVGVVGAVATGASLAPALVGAAGYLLLAFALNRALLGEKRRLAGARAELSRLRQGIDSLDAIEPGGEALRPTTASLTLRQVSEEGRRARQAERSAELDADLELVVRLAQDAVQAHAVLYFAVDRKRDAAFLRVASGPDSIVKDAAVPLAQDPLAFVLDRNDAFYATDFPRLLHALPYYRGNLKVGTLLALPVRLGEAVAGVLLADRLEAQGFTGGEPRLLEGFADLAARALQRVRDTQSREEMATEVKAVYSVSRSLTNLSDPAPVRRQLVRSARDLLPGLEAAALVTTDEQETRYVVEAEGHGWVKEFAGREVGLDEKTWAAWVLRSAEEPYLLDDIASHGDRMPVVALDEGSGRAESLLAMPLRARGRTLGALLLTGRRGAFDATAHRVLGILANQASGALATIGLVERNRRRALRDGLTELYNRGAFDQLLARTLAQAERASGRFGVLLLDLDHFKKLNDSYGHLAGDAALRAAARLLEGHLRKGDIAARYGGEEFVAILPGADEAGACQLGERVRSAIGAQRLVFEGARIAVTASIGVASWPADGNDAEALLSAADSALYAAKEGGRDRVVAASSVPREPTTASS